MTIGKLLFRKKLYDELLKINFNLQIVVTLIIWN